MQSLHINKQIYLKLRKTLVMKFGCAMVVFVVEEFYMTCMCILCILDELLIQQNTFQDVKY